MLRQHDTDALLDALAFAFVSVCVTQINRRPAPAAVEEFRRLAREALARALEPPPFGDEDTEPRTARRPR